MEHGEVLKVCDERFNRIEDRLEKGDDLFRQHGERIVKNDTNVEHLTSSLSALTKAIWGMVGSIVLLLVGFFIWYVQTK